MPWSRAALPPMSTWYSGPAESCCRGMEALGTSWWSGPLLWAKLHVLDRALVLRAVRPHEADQQSAGQFRSETSPAARAIPRRRGRSFWTTTLAGAFILCAIQRAAAAVHLPEPYLFVLGALVLLEVPLLLRHVYVLAQRDLIARGAITGHVEYAPWAAHDFAAVEFLAFASVLAAASVIAREWFVVGGVASCIVTGLDEARKGSAERRRAARRSRRNDGG